MKRAGKGLPFILMVVVGLMMIGSVATAIAGERCARVTGFHEGPGDTHLVLTGAPCDGDYYVDAGDGNNRIFIYDSPGNSKYAVKLNPRPGQANMVVIVDAEGADYYTIYGGEEDEVHIWTGLSGNSIVQAGNSYVLVGIPQGKVKIHRQENPSPEHNGDSVVLANP